VWCGVLDAGGEEGQGSGLADAGEDVDAELDAAPGRFDGGVEDAAAVVSMCLC
jgi:hypothetical protein